MKTRIKELRLEKKLTQQTLAKHLGINQASLSKLECEASIPDAALLIDLANFFHVSTDYILFRSNERLNTDHFLENNLCHLKKYQHFIVLFQKMNAKQLEYCYKFLCSIMEANDD